MLFIPSSDYRDDELLFRLECWNQQITENPFGLDLSKVSKVFVVDGALFESRSARELVSMIKGLIKQKAKISVSDFVLI
jgi:hypothetical protein